MCWFGPRAFEEIWFRPHPDDHGRLAVLRRRRPQSQDRELARANLTKGTQEKRFKKLREIRELLAFSRRQREIAVRRLPSRQTSNGWRKRRGFPDLAVLADLVAFRARWGVENQLDRVLEPSL
jgi:hypothetical protein